MQTETLPTSAGPALGLLRNLAHGDYLKGPGLSNSALKTLRKSPGHFAALHLLPLPEWLITDDDHVDTASPMFAGTLCHAATLEPDSFAERYTVGPDLNKNTKAWKEFVQANASRVVITSRQREVALCQAKSLRANPDVADILDGGDCEISAYAVDPATGVLCRCRPDCANSGFGQLDKPAAMLLDVKTTTDLSDDALSRTVWNYGYHLQDAWYSQTFALASGIPVAGFVFAFVENAYPFACRVFELDDMAKAIARRENRQALDLYARCERERAWPGYPSTVGTLSLPSWATRGDL